MICNTNKDYSYKYANGKYFNLRGYIEKVVGKDWRNLSFSFILQAERNIGKSYGTWDWIDKDIWIASGYKDRVAYCRTNLEKLSKIRSFFNQKFKGRYLMTKEFIYKIELDETGKEIKEARLEIGAVISIPLEENWRSGEFYNYRVIFWDEFNEENKTPKLWKHWINLYKTIERMTPNCIVLLMGNKIDGSNDILVKLEIEPKFTEPEDFCLQITDPDEYHQIYYVEIGLDTFKVLDQNKQGANTWAKFDTTTDNFLNNGGFLNKHVSDVLIYKKRIEPTKKVKFYIAFGEYKIEYGSFELGYYFHEITEFPKDATPLAFDVLGLMRQDKTNTMYDKQDYIDLCEMLAFAARNKKLFYSSYELKQILEMYIIRWVSLTKE